MKTTREALARIAAENNSKSRKLALLHPCPLQSSTYSQLHMVYEQFSTLVPSFGKFPPYSFVLLAQFSDQN